ncbi:MAG: hypothetical protein PHG85_01475 [Candidatus Altiarchaeota archaeon]|nr:hypothetical protein [Candidatus Altiarchaeota archaeon]
MKEIKIGNKEYDVIGENKLTARIFEAVVARSSTIADGLDRAWKENYKRKEGETPKPTYKHTIYLGRDDNGKNLRAGIAVFNNSVVVQTLKEK